MPDASPADAAEGMTPDANEGQEPDEETTEAAGQEPREPRTYPEAYVRQLRRENASTRTKLAELEERQKELEDADKSELERTTERATKAEARAAEAELKLLRLEVAAERGLDAKAVQFLTGSTREELELRAEELAALLDAKAKPTAAGFDGGARTPAPVKGSPEEEHNRFLLEALGRKPARS